MTVFDASTIARGWLAVATASSADKNRPQLDRTISIEAYPEGFRIVATDSYVLLRAWVTNIENDDAPEPGLDEKPYATAVAQDPYGRAKGFMRHALRLAAEANELDDPAEVRINLGVIDDLDAKDRPALEGMAARYVTLELPDAERVKLTTYEGEYPSWRHAVSGFAAKRVDAIALDADIIARLAKAGKITHTPVGFSWGGRTGVARLDLVDSYPSVDGLVMPCRWDFDTDAPRDEPEPPRGRNDNAGMTAEDAAAFITDHAEAFLPEDLLPADGPETPADRKTRLANIKAAFRAASKILHPDLGGDPADFRTLKEAAALLEKLR